MKLSKDAVAYEHPASKPENHCGVCRHFEPPAACGIVAGRIRPEDWCQRFLRSNVMGSWVSLEYDDEEMAEAAMPSMPAPPQYPYGCRICLTGMELEKLGLPLPRVDQLLDFRCFAKVTGVPSADRVEMQIVMIKDIENEDEEAEVGGGDDDDEPRSASVYSHPRSQKARGGDEGIHDKGDGEEAFRSKAEKYKGGGR